MLKKTAKKVLYLVKTGIFYEFFKSGFSTPRPGETKTGTSDVIPGHQNRRHTPTKAVVYENSCYSGDIC